MCSGSQPRQMDGSAYSSPSPYSTLHLHLSVSASASALIGLSSHFLPELNYSLKGMRGNERSVREQRSQSSDAICEIQYPHLLLFPHILAFFAFWPKSNLSPSMMFNDSGDALCDINQIRVWTWLSNEILRYAIKEWTSHLEYKYYLVQEFIYTCLILPMIFSLLQFF